jgi:hypothetical protein
MTDVDFILSSSTKSAILIIIAAKTFKMIFSRELFVKEPLLQQIL